MIKDGVGSVKKCSYTGKAGESTHKAKGIKVYIWNVWSFRATDICVNIWTCIDLIGFTGNIVHTMLSPLTYLHKWCQVTFGLVNGLDSVQCQPTTWTNAALLPLGPWKNVDNWFKTWVRDKMDPSFQTTFSNAFSRKKMFKFWLIFHWIFFSLGSSWL